MVFFKYSLRTEFKIISQKYLIVVFVMGDSHFPMQRHTQLFVTERIINQKREYFIIDVQIFRTFTGFLTAKVCSF